MNRTWSELFLRPAGAGGCETTATISKELSTFRCASYNICKLSAATDGEPRKTIRFFSLSSREEMDAESVAATPAIVRVVWEKWFELYSFTSGEDREDCKTRSPHPRGMRCKPIVRSIATEKEKANQNCLIRRRPSILAAEC